MKINSGCVTHISDRQLMKAWVGLSYPTRRSTNQAACRPEILLIFSPSTERSSEWWPSWVQSFFLDRRLKGSPVPPPVRWASLFHRGCKEAEVRGHQASWFSIPAVSLTCWTQAVFLSEAILVPETCEIGDNGEESQWGQFDLIGDINAWQLTATLTPSWYNFIYNLISYCTHLPHSKLLSLSY